MAYEILISKHARERWVERVVDPKRYEHFRFCNKGCEQCISLYYDINNVIAYAKRGIDHSISQAYFEAKHKDWRVTDKNFIEVQKQFSDYKRFEFYLIKTGHIFVVTIDEAVPTLLTVLSPDMLDGTVINNKNGQELKTVFKGWKADARQKTFKREIREL